MSNVRHLDYDEPVLGYHRIVAAQVAAVAPVGGRVADLGCGPGQVLAELRRLRPDLKLVAVDDDPQCLRLAEARTATAEPVRADITQVTDDLIGRPDVIVSCHSLEHLPDPVGALGQWSRLLSAEGRLVVAVPNAHQPLMLARSLFRRPKANEGHYYIWDRATFDTFCRLTGMAVEARSVDYVPL
ncbi:MAG: class I SAM-dependent methyltransferase, partial [Actinomycetota bacterium]